jgi:hypothetical protein
VITNPYVPINLIRHSAALASNFSNSAAMYHPAASSGAFATATWLIFEGTSPFAAAAGLVAGVILLRRIRREALLFIVPVILILTQFIALAAGKPGEYARFALFPDITLAMLAILGLARIFPSRLAQIPLCAVILFTQAFHCFGYLQGFRADTTASSSRRMSAAYLASMADRDHRLLIEAEPAPYILPPVDVFHWQLILPPRNSPVAPDSYDASVRTLSWHKGTPMSWANIFFVLSENPAPPLTTQR